MTAFPDAWQEVCLIGIIPENGSEVQYAGITEDITELTIGDKDIDIKALVNGGYVTQFSPRGPGQITFKAYDITAKNDGTGFIQLFDPSYYGTGWGEDTTQPITATASYFRRKAGIILLWSTKLPATAGTVPVANEPAFRIEIVNAYMTSYKPSYNDKIWSSEVTFKFAPLSKSAAPNYRFQSTDGTVVLGAAITTATALP
jgi:hypothetical protein